MNPISLVRRRPTTRALLTVLLLHAGCAREVPAPAVEAPRVVAVPVAAVDLEQRIEVTGELQAPLRTFVAARVGGEITLLHIKEGQPVDAHTAVIEIDPQRRKLELDAAQASAAQAQASLAQARRQADRLRKLQSGGVASSAQLDEAELAFQLADSRLSAERARLELAKQALDDATVRAPFAGVVGIRKVNLGEVVQIGTPLVEFVSLDPIEIIFHVAELDSSLVRIGQKVMVSVAPYPNERFEAVVDVVYPALDPQSRTLRAKARLANPDGKLRPGLFARAELGIAQRKGVPMVPSESILQRADGPVVFVLGEGGKVHRRVVKLGAYRATDVEIRDGLKPGEMILLRGHTDLLDGASVQVVGPDLPADTKS